MSLADELAADADAVTVAPARRSLSEDMAASVAPKAKAEAPDPTGSTFQNVAAGAGKAVYDIARGGGQIIREGLEKVGGKAAADKAGLPTRADIDEVKRRDAALMGTAAGNVGYVGGNVASMMLPLAGMARLGVPLAGAMVNPATYGAAAGAGALSGAVQPVGTDDSRARNMVTGGVAGVAGNAAINAVGRVAQPVQAALDPVRARAVQVLEAAGVPLDAAQRSGSVLLNRMRSGFSDNPFTAGRQAEQIAGQRAAFNNAVLRTIGEEGPAATQEVMHRADTRIGAVFHDILERNNVQVTDPLLNRIADIQRSATDEERHAVSNLANRLIGSVDANGAIPGQAAYNIKKDLDRLASSSDTTLAYHARQLRTTLMDGINDSLSGADRAAFGEARQQFRNMKTIESAIDKEGAGSISPSILANTLGQKRNRAASIYGRGDQDLVSLGQAGKMLLTDKTPNSGTTARAAMQVLAPLAASVAGGSYDAYQGEYGSAAAKAGAAALAAMAGPRAAQAMIANPTMGGYLVRGVQNVPLRALMTAPQDYQLVGGALRRLPGAMAESQ